MSERDVRERDILVAPNEYAYVQDLTKGDIVLYVGPTKISLSNTERMILLERGRFVSVPADEANLGVHCFVEATSEQYIVLENPPVDEAVSRPVKGANSAIALQTGRKVVVPGPAEFPLWPGQRAQVVNGHELSEDEYLVVRVCDAVPGDGPPIGSEHIIRGTNVSFYIPTTGLEVVPEAGCYVRTAWRLEKNRGLHVRVVAAFEADDDGHLPPGQYVAGQDVFVRGREGYFFPTDRVEVVADIDPIPLAEKEAIYVRNRETGAISTIHGPANYLPDPTREQVVSRDIDPQLLYLYNAGDRDPDRALSIYVPPSTAVMVTATNRREVIVGPQTRVLAYDEDLEVLTLSTGRPKSDGEMLPTCFLQIEGNKVSDVVRVKTADHVELSLLLSYRVSFAKDSHRWFNVKDYVGLLCDHLGSIIRAAARGAPIERFHADGVNIVRDAVLGTRTEGGERTGRTFEENGMWVYDIELLDVSILDADVEQMLSEAQRLAIVSEIARKEEQLRLGDERLKESVNREIYTAQMETLTKAAEYEVARRDVELARAQVAVDLDQLAQVSAAQHRAESLAVTSRAESAAAKQRDELEREMIRARSAAFREQIEALQPELIATLKQLANKQLAAELSRNLSPLAILGGESVADVAGRLLERLPLGSNGHATDVRAILGLVDDDDQAG